MGRKDGKKHKQVGKKLQNASKNVTNNQGPHSNPLSNEGTDPCTSSRQQVQSSKSSKTSQSSQNSQGSNTKQLSCEVKEKEMYIDRVLSSLRNQGEQEEKGKYIERVITSISDLLNLEESLDLATVSEESDANTQTVLKQETTTQSVQKKAEEETSCHFCQATSKTRCTGCRLVFYCDKECQRKDWKVHKETCRPYKVAKKKDLGRILTASRDLQTDELILSEASLALGPKPGPGPICLTCYRKVTGNYRCPKCGVPMCPNDSQEQSESGTHASLECQLAGNDEGKAETHREVPDGMYEAITALRCLIAKRKDPERWKSALERFDLKFMELVGSSESNSGAVEGVRQSLNFFGHPDILANVSQQELHQVLGLLQIHHLPTKLPYTEVQGLFPMASLLSHSCKPNCKLCWDNKTMKLQIKAGEPIARGTPLTTIYTDILWGTRARRDHLQQSRLISCACVRCKDPTELNTNFSALICSQCPKRSVVLPLDPLNNNSVWECRSGGHQITAGEAFQQTLSLGAAVTQALESPSISTSEALQAEWGPRVHTNHYHLHALKHSLFQLYGRDQDKREDKDDVHWEEMTKKEKACKEFLTVCSLLDPALGNTIPLVGVTFFEYHKTILQSAKRNFGLARITTMQLKKRMLLSKELLKKSMEMFKEEAPDTPEGQLYLTCQEEIISIGKWMLAVGLVG